jgi:hypothetical protein
VAGWSHLAADVADGGGGRDEARWRLVAGWPHPATDFADRGRGRDGARWRLVATPSADEPSPPSCVCVGDEGVGRGCPMGKTRGGAARRRLGAWGGRGDGIGALVGEWFCSRSRVHHIPVTQTSKMAASVCRPVYAWPHPSST